MQVIEKTCDVHIEKSNTHDARFVMSAVTPDRVNDTIELSAYQPNLNKRLIALYQHNHEKIIGYWENLRINAGQLIGDIKFASTDLGQMVKTLINDGVPLAASIGFRAKGEPNDKGGYHFKELDLLECSVVSVPCHPQAIQIAKSFNINLDEVSSKGVEHQTHNKADAVQNLNTKPKRYQSMNISEQIKQARSASVAERDTLVQLQSKFDAGEDVTKELDAQMDAVEKADAEVQRLERLEKLTAGSVSKPVSTSNAPMINKQTYREKDVPAGTHLARMGMIKLAAYHDRRTPEDALAEQMFPGEKATMAIVKSASRVADTTTAGWAQELVRQELRGMVMGDLAPISVAAALAAAGTYINFGGARAITMPSMSNNTTNLAGAFVGENGVIPVKEGVVSSLRIEAFKMGVITTMTKELERSSDPDAVELLRRMMMQDTANALDTAVIDTSAAVAGVRPKGILNGVTIGSGTAGGGVAAISADLKTLLGAFITANVGAKPVLVMNTATKLSLTMTTNALGEFLYADEVARGTLHGIPIIASNRVTANRVILVDAAYFAAAFDTPEIDVSEQASLTMANANGTAPTQADNGSGVVGTAEQIVADGGAKILGASGTAFTGITGVSLFQQYALGIRLVMPVGWGMTYAGTVAALNSVTW